MGFHITMYAGTASHVEQEKIQSLLVQLVEQEYVTFPFMMLKGNFNLDQYEHEGEMYNSILMPCEVTSKASHLLIPAYRPFLTEEEWQKQIDIFSYGVNTEQFLKGIQSFDIKEDDYCVFFYLNYRNQQLCKSFEDQNMYCRGEVVLFFHRQPQHILIFDAYSGDWDYLKLKNYFCIEADNGPETITGTLLEPLLIKYFGHITEDYTVI